MIGYELKETEAFLESFTRRDDVEKKIKKYQDDVKYIFKLFKL